MKDTRRTGSLRTFRAMVPYARPYGGGIALGVVLIVVAVGLVRSDGVAVFGTASDIGGGQATALGGGRFVYRLVLVAPPLLPGSYRLQVHAEDPEGLRLFDTVACTVTVPGSSRESGLVRLAHRWP